ncbi:MAG: hypothetical protein OES57_07805 [Acidimicrobiia bacterium]|nr:hypothetical protein [Acidimicrobiia bacterium]
MDVTGLVVLSVRCVGSECEEWEQWSRGPHLDRLADLRHVGAVSRASVVPEPKLAMPGPGFSHIELIELIDDVDAGATDVRAALVAERAGRDGRSDHAVVRGEALVPHGPHTTEVGARASSTGHILADVLCTDHTLELEWDRWYDDVHLPDMLATGAFAGGSRWRRRLRPQWGAAHVTLYDIGLPDVTDAVDRSAAAMPDLVAAGRKHPCHCGGPTVLVERTSGPG